MTNIQIYIFHYILSILIALVLLGYVSEPHWLDWDTKEIERGQDYYIKSTNVSDPGIDFQWFWTLDSPKHGNGVIYGCR